MGEADECPAVEKEEKVPKGMELIHPKPDFVAKTYKMEKGAVKGDKLWMNITSSDSVAQPSKEMVKGGERCEVAERHGQRAGEIDAHEVDPVDAISPIPIVGAINPVPVAEQRHLAKGPGGLGIAR